MVHSSKESQQTRTFPIDHENVLPDHYRLIELIGRGGMAEVYLAEDRRLGRKVAIKFLTAEFRRDPDRLRRFRQEARSASALNHPNILIIHDIGDRGGVQFIVSEFVEGETLGTRIAQGPVPFAEAVDIAIQAASALSAAHTAGIVHRDIKPDNIMIRSDGVVKVLDFGLAKARGFTTSDGADFDATTIDSGSTSPGLIVGTPQYMSPEQARGKELDGRTDIFSLGIIIFEMVTGHSPFAGGSFADTMAAILTKEPRRIEEFVENPPHRLATLVDKCLRKGRDERFASMAELESELRLLRTEVIATPKDTTEVDPARSDRTEIRPTDQHSIRRFVSSTFQRPSPIAAVIILVAGALLAGGWWAWDRIPSLSSEASLMRTVPITSWSSSANELVRSASFSPNGSMVAYSVRNGYSTEIWVKPVSGGDAVQVTKNGGYNQYPIWSPDGQELAFFSDLGNAWGVWKIPFTGGNVVRILGEVDPTTRPVLWGKNGKLYFQSKRELFRTADSGSMEQVTDFRGLGIAVNTIQISDDESSIAYSSKHEDGWRLSVRGLAADVEKVIGRSPDQIDHIAWHPNGRSVFASFTIEQALHVVEASVNGTSATQRSNGDINFAVHDVSEVGAVLYGTLAETSDLWRIDTSTSTESIVANDVALETFPDVAYGGSIAFQLGTHVERPDWSSVKLASNTQEMTNVSAEGFSPSWSNDGEWIAFFRNSGAGAEIWKARPNGMNLTRISGADAVHPAYIMAPYLTKAVSNIAWSPDDKRVAFVAQHKGARRVFVSNTDGTDTGVSVGRDAISGDREWNPLWTPDGAALVSCSTSPPTSSSPKRTYRIHVTDVASGERKLLFEGSDQIRVLGLSSGRSDVIFAAINDRAGTSPTAETTTIYSLTIQGGHPVKLKELRFAYFDNVHLSRNGQVLGYVTRSSELTAIATEPLVGGNTKVHLTINDPKILVTSLGMSHDGSFVVFGKQTRTNLLSMLKR